MDLAFQAEHHATVARFRAAATGDADHVALGERPYHPAFVLDPDGNNVGAVFHAPSTPSAASGVIPTK